jgi:hypothetical protein
MAPYVWQNKLMVQWEIDSGAQDKRVVTLKVLPRADVLRYTLNGAEPRNGIDYSAPFTVGPEAAILLVYTQRPVTSKPKMTSAYRRLLAVE